MESLGACIRVYSVPEYGVSILVVVPDVKMSSKDVE